VNFDIRELEAADLPRIAAADGGPAWHGGIEKWRGRLLDQANGKRIVLVAADGAEILGYGSLLWASGYPPFRNAKIPEINDLVVAEKHRKRGIATGLIQELEKRACAARRPKIGVGVGLYADYGPAQRLYVHLGYVPDGSGITSHDLFVPAGHSVTVDDDLALWLVKPLVAQGTIPGP
jgi:GNAT superfamily N-acetyltransferase